MENDNDQFGKDFNEDKLFTKGFNAGYLLSKHEPELLDRVLKSPNEEFFYLGGMKAGKQQHQKEQFIERLNQTQQKSKDKGKERGV